MAGFGWVVATLIAAAAQTARNATQASLTRTLGTIGATQVRFLFGLPFALLFLALVAGFTGQPVPPPTLAALGFTLLGALSQIAATAVMLYTMKSQSFAVTTTWIKTEPVLVALIAAVVLGDPLTLPMLLAIAIATVGVILMSLKPGTAFWREAGPVLTGLLAGGLFGLSAIGFRGGILALPSGDFLIRASTILALGLALQVAVLSVWMLAFDRRALIASLGAWRPSLGAGFLGAFASQFWFIGFSLTSAANVRTLALVEVIFAQAVSFYLFRQRLGTRRMLGMAIIVLGVALLLRSQV
jgi:drug/metabolite transporter (DMT)-like permease